MTYRRSTAGSPRSAARLDATGPWRPLFRPAVDLLAALCRVDAADGGPAGGRDCRHAIWRGTDGEGAPLAAVAAGSADGTVPLVPVVGELARGARSPGSWPAADWLWSEWPVSLWRHGARRSAWRVDWLAAQRPRGGARERAGARLFDASPPG